MKLLLDTNRYSDFARGIPEVERILEAADAIFVPFVVVAELRFGFLKGNRTAENDLRLDEFFRRPNVKVLFPDDLTIRHFSIILLALMKQGTPIPVHDVWIAALAVQHDLTIFARDKHFHHISRLQLI